CRIHRMTVGSKNRAVEAERSKILGLMGLRLLLVVVFLGAAVWVQVKAGLSFLERPLLFLYGIIVAALILTVIYALLLKWFASLNLKRFAYLQLAGDVLLITAAIYVTGGIESLFSFLYFFSIISGSILFSRRGGILLASLSSITYAGVLIDLKFYGILAGRYGSLSAPSLHEINNLFYTLFVTILAFFMVAFLSGYLAERILRTERALEASKVEFRRLEDINKSIIENINSGILTLDREGRITSFNRAAEDLTGYSLQEIYHRGINELFPEFLSLKVRIREEFAFEKKDGAKLSLGLSSSLLKDEEGKDSGQIIIFRDMTQLKKMEEEIRKTDRLRSLGELAAGMAHEIRNPLASISGSIQVLREDLDLNTDDKHLMNIILRETERLNALATEFLVFARPATKKKRVYLKDIIEETLELVETRNGMPLIAISGEINRQEVKVSVDIKERITIDADPKQIKQVFLNILLNAFQSIKDNGEISITARLSLPSDNVTVSMENAFAEITIVDTGSGIDEKDIDRIFDPFFTTRESGTGLGLAVVYRIVEGHGGTIDVKSKKGEGTTLRIRLPILAT
ncbi:MAG: nitrogen regulation protein NR(II), partial [Thermodesulfobacteriota bacterium]